MKKSAECLEQRTEKAVHIQNQINEITSSSSRAAGVELPGQWRDIHNTSKKPSESTRTKKKNRSKLMVKMSRGPHNRILVATSAYYSRA